MNVKIYNNKRDELSRLLKDVVSNLEKAEKEYHNLDLTSLTESRKAIAEIRQRVYEDIFKIVLVAKFQGGKSTSFNAMTGGACYSPMGNGAIKCSAAPIYAKNVVNKKDEGVTVFMRSDEELSELLSAGGFLDVDLKSKESIKIAKEEWSSRFQIWQGEPRVIKTDEERDMFFVAGFILNFCENNDVKELRGKKVVKSEFVEIAKYAQFPEQYITRYAEKGPKAFTEKEVIYAFVSKIEVRVQSKEMAKIGASFVDAPGLFANEYDTRITRSELCDANAVWYLLGAMQPGDGELKAIRECLELCKGRVFFSSNIFANLIAKPLWCKQVLPQINTTINNAVGEKVEVRPYHAQLALLYIQGEEFVSTGHWNDGLVKEYLVKACESLGVPDALKLDAEDCWRRVVRFAVSRLYPAGLPKFEALKDPLSKEGLAILREESNWDGTIEAIREFVINTKGKSILITDTAQKALELLGSLKRLLVQREGDAEKSFEETRNDYSAAEKKLEAFNTFANEQITNQLAGKAGESKDEVIATDLFNDVLKGGISEIAEMAAPEIVASTGLFRIVGAKLSEWGRKGWQKITNWFKDAEKKDFSEVENSYSVEITRIMQNAMKTVIDGRMNRWIQSIKDGQNETFKVQVINSANATYRLLESEWGQKCATDKLLAALTPECPAMPDSIEHGRFDSPEIMSFLTKVSFAEFVKDMVVYVTAILSCCAIPEPITATIAFIISAFILIYRKMASVDQMEKEMKGKIISCLTKSFVIENKEVWIKEIAKKISVFRKAVIRVMKKPFEDIGNRFEQAKKAALSEHMKTKENRKCVAEQCKAIRELYIDGENGLEKRLITYIKETESLCAAK